MENDEGTLERKNVKEIITGILVLPGIIVMPGAGYACDRARFIHVIEPVMTRCPGRQLDIISNRTDCAS